MQEEVFDKITEYIDAIATNLGVATEFVYEIMTKQMFLEGLVYSIFLPIITIVLGVIEYKLVKFSFKDNDFTENGMLAIFVGVIFVAVFIVTIFSLPESIMQMFNPEYYVVKEILGLFK